MSEDIWSTWLLEKRFGNNPGTRETVLRRLRYHVDTLLTFARLSEGSVVLDVGCGDGFVGFSAISKIGKSGQVIFSDISQPLLDRARQTASQEGLLDRCQFLNTPATDLAPIRDESVDLVAMRSVLIYVAEKASAIREFHRVLKVGGMLALCEPVSRHSANEFPLFGEWEPLGVSHLLSRLREFYAQLQPASDPMNNFDEWDLIKACEAAEFTSLRLTLVIDVVPAGKRNWDTQLNTEANPRVPSLAAAMARIFTNDEQRDFESRVRPAIEQGYGKVCQTLAYLWAVK